MPKKLSFEKAAAVPLTGLTAYQSLFDKAGLKKGETCLVVGASGGVGSFAVQFARLAGAKVIAVASKKNHAYLRSLGAKHVIDYTTQDVLAEVRGIAAKGADVVFDLIGGDSLRRSYECARSGKGGRVVTIVEPGDQSAAAQKGFKLIYNFVEPNAPQLERFARWFDHGGLKVTLSKSLPLKEAALAHELIETGHTRGKIVLKIS
jgi:NADPH:quinone reductase-like Zn-dependent oxidoreductase